MIYLKLNWNTGEVLAFPGNDEPGPASVPLFTFPPPSPRPIALPAYSVLRAVRAEMEARGIGPFDVKASRSDRDRICGAKWEKHAGFKSSDREFDRWTFGSQPTNGGCRQAHCLSCLSTLTRPAMLCPRCAGSGRTSAPTHAMGDCEEPCRLCDGDGKVSDEMMEASDEVTDEELGYLEAGKGMGNSGDEPRDDKPRR